MGGFMNFLEISLHIEQQLVKLLSLSENAKYYALIHHNKFESFIDDFNLTVNQEMKSVSYTHLTLPTIYSV